MGCAYSAFHDHHSDISFDSPHKDSNGAVNSQVLLPLVQRGIRLQVAKDVLKLLNEGHEKTAKEMLKREPSPGEIIVHGFVKSCVTDQSYAEYLKSRPASAHLVGEVNTFVSHAWGSSFKGTVGAIEEFEATL